MKMNGKLSFAGQERQISKGKMLKLKVGMIASSSSVYSPGTRPGARSCSKELAKAAGFRSL